MKVKKFMLWLLILAMAVTFIGCGAKNEPVAIDEGTGEIPETLSIYTNTSAYSRAAGAKDNNDLLCFQAMEELTGCHVEWIHPPVGGGSEKFNLIIASGELPDMMVTSWARISGGAKMYADDGIIIPLSGLIKKYMPNLSAYMEEHPEVAKQFTNDEGEIYYIPFIRRDPELKVFEGPIIRQDWLDKLGLDTPSNPDELYKVLKAFKEDDPNGNGKKDEIPMTAIGFENSSYGIGDLLWMFGTTYDYYIGDDGKVTHGILEDNFEEGLKYIIQLYKEGLIDPDYILNDTDKLSGKIMNDQAGFAYSAQPSKYYANMNDGVRKVVGIPHLKKDGVKHNVFEEAYVMDVTTISMAVTTANKNPSGSLRWFDNFYGGKGMEIFNSGVEGVSYERDANGQPKFTDYIFNNPNGKSSQEMQGLTIGTTQSPFPAMQLWNNYSQTLAPWGKESVEIWMNSANADGVLAKFCLSLTEEENDIVTKRTSEIATYFVENINKIIIGNADISTLPKIRETVKQMGIDEVIDIYNAALERYNKR